MEIKGKVLVNLGVQRGTSKSGKEWAKASIVVETDEQYPKKIVLDNMKSAEDFGSLKVGDVGVFNADVESREYNGRWYTSVLCWKWEIERPQAQYATRREEPQSWEARYPQAPPSNDDAVALPQGNDGLPF